MLFVHIFLKLKKEHLDPEYLNYPGQIILCAITCKVGLHYHKIGVRANVLAIYTRIDCHLNNV